MMVFLYVYLKSSTPPGKYDIFNSRGQRTTLCCVRGQLPPRKYKGRPSSEKTPFLWLSPKLPHPFLFAPKIKSVKINHQLGQAPPIWAMPKRKSVFFSGRSSLRYNCFFLFLENISHALGFVFRWFWVCSFPPFVYIVSKLRPLATPILET